MYYKESRKTNIMSKQKANFVSSKVVLQYVYELNNTVSHLLFVHICTVIRGILNMSQYRRAKLTRPVVKSYLQEKAKNSEAAHWLHKQALLQQALDSSLFNSRPPTSPPLSNSVVLPVLFGVICTYTARIICCIVLQLISGPCILRNSLSLVQLE